MLHEKHKNLIVLTGPTAVGKTDLSIMLAKRVNGEIISADSIQIYKHFDIGSAKITETEKQGILHHLIDVLEPDEGFNVATFKKLALSAMEDIYSRGRIPIITGGTGFYIQSILKDIDYKEEQDDGYRDSLVEIYKSKGIEPLITMLREVDPEALLSIHQNNSKRIIRALEYFHQTNEKISEHNKRESSKDSPYNFCYFVLTCDRAVLYNRIEQRIDTMIENGLIEEVKALKEEYNLTKHNTSMQGIGYKEILEYLNQNVSLEEAVDTLKKNTRHFAKRQLTWFRRESDVVWVDKDVYNSNEKCIDFMLKTLREKNIII